MIVNSSNMRRRSAMDSVAILVRTMTWAVPLCAAPWDLSLNESGS